MIDSKIETEKHIENVRILLYDVIVELVKRSNNHDHSKLFDPEKSIFDEYSPKLKETTYGSYEYNNYLKEMKVALDHHYSVNPHHPEYFENGIKDMNLIDLIEMLVDWYAASKRHDDGDIYKSIEFNQQRFNYGDELKQIFINTIKDIG